jgi:hypothetical protein
MDAQSTTVTPSKPPSVPPPTPADIEPPFWWSYHEIIPNLHRSNKSYQLRLGRYLLRTDGEPTSRDEWKKYELVLIETAVLFLHARRSSNDNDLRAVLGGFFPKEPLALGQAISETVSSVCGITLEEKQMALHLRVSVFRYLNM